MRLDPLRPAAPYAFGVLAVALALATRWPLWPVLGSAVPHITLFPAVLAAAYLGGLWPGLLATAVGAVGAVYFVVEPVDSFRLATSADAAGLALVVGGGTVMSWLCESLHRAAGRVVESEERFMRHLPGLAWIKDGSGRYVFVNDAAADPARTKGGLGLGLAVVRGLIELHGGRTSAASDGPGRGSTFAVGLPLDRVAEPAVGEVREEPPAVGMARRVVIVEDGEDAAESLRELLELKGFDVSVAFTGPDGVALALCVAPDAIVCDLGLPGMTGFEVARALRAAPSTAAAVLVAVSGYAQEEDRRKARDAGFDALLAKPADTDELVRLLIRARS